MLSIDKIKIDSQITALIKASKEKAKLTISPYLNVLDIMVTSLLEEEVFTKEISVNNPYRYKGMTVYQADWSLAAITITINNSPKLQLPLQKIDELDEKLFGKK